MLIHRPFPLFLRALLALLLTGCALVPSQPSAAWDLIIAVPGGDPARAAQAAADTYAQQTGLRVLVEDIGSEVYDDRVSAVLLAGVPKYDLVYLPAESLPKWDGYNMLQPLDLPADENIKPWLPLVTVDDQVIGVPTQPDVDVLWYRTDLTEAAGISVPTRWNAVQDAAHSLGMPIALAAGEMDAGRDLAALIGKENLLEQSEAGWRVNVEAMGAALELYSGWRSASGAADSASIDWTRANVLKALQNSQASMGILPLSAADTLLDCKKSKAVCRNGTPLLAFAPLPGMEAELGISSAQAWVVPLKAPHPEAAQAFAAWLASADGARAWAAGGGLPARQDVLAEIDGPAAQALAGIESARPAFPPLIPADAIWKALNIAGHTTGGRQLPYYFAQEAALSIEAALRQSGYTVVESSTEER